MLTQSYPQTITRPQVINAISQICKEWQQAVENRTLLEVQGSVGLLLVDLVVAFGLTPNEQQTVLGVDFFEEIEVLSITPRDNGRN